jgi:NodT family efflux transporter outer membrane factor (OMF) lipoprotein
MRSLLATVMLATLALGGCAISDVDQRNATVDPSRLGLSGPELPPAADGWWHALGDPQLDALIARALEHNPRLEEALARVRAAQASAAAAEGDRLPRVTLDGDEQFQRFSNRFIYPPPYGGGHYWLGSVQSNLSWDLDFWGRQQSLIDQARSGARAASLDADAARLALTGALVEAYIALDRSYALLEVAERTAGQRSRLVDLVGRRVDAGLDSRIEAKQAEGRLAEARVARLQAEAQRDMAVHAIAALTGQGADAYRSISRPELDPAAVLPLPSDLPANLLGRRPDILAARLRVEAALSGREAARAAFYPNINLTAFAGFQAIGLSHLLSSGSGVYGAGPAIHLPLFDGRLKPNYEAATAEADIAVSAYNGTVLAAVQQTADRLTAIRSIKAQIADQTKALSSAEEAYGLAERRYGKGISNYVAVISAEEQLLDARREIAVLNAQYAVERVRLVLAVGGDFQPDPDTLSSAAAPARPAVKE